MKQTYLFNHEYKYFTCDEPKNTFVIDNSNGYPVVMTTDVTEKTKWSDIFKGNYKNANENGTPEYLMVDGKKYTYIDKKYASKYLGLVFVADDKCTVSEYKSKFEHKLNTFCKKVL